MGDRVATASGSGGGPGSAPTGSVAAAQPPVNSGQGSRPAARQDLDALLGDLAGVCGQLEELATTLRRDHAAGTSRRQLPLAFPHRLQGEARQLAGTLRALAEAGTRPDPDLISSAGTQLAALRGEVTAAAGDRCGPHASSTPAHDPGTAILTGIEHTLDGVLTRQRSLISHLADTTEGPAPSTMRTPADARGVPMARMAPDETPR
jgi:hypothetical protein